MTVVAGPAHAGTEGARGRARTHAGRGRSWAGLMILTLISAEVIWIGLLGAGIYAVVLR